MKKLAICLLLSLCSGVAGPKKPKLIVTVVVDQFRYDYLTRFQSEYTGGLARLLTKGAVFSNASYNHVPAITAVGHSTFLTGATPSISGIVGNDWFDRDEGVHVTSVSDAKTQLLGGSGAGSSPQIAKAKMVLGKNPGEAMAIAEQILNADPHNSAAHRIIVDAAQVLELPRTAAMSFESLVSNSPKAGGSPLNTRRRSRRPATSVRPSRTIAKKS